MEYPSGRLPANWRQALFVVNLEPRTIRGETSEGMLFDVGMPMD